MQNSYVTLWTLERCKWLHQVGDQGPLEVIFGGVHTSLPSLGAVAIGDVIYPVAVKEGGLCVIARMEVESLVEPDDYISAKQGFTRPPTDMWDKLFHDLKRTRAKDVGHRFPTTCSDIAAVGFGSDIRFDRILRCDLLNQIMLGPKPGREQAIKGVKDGRLLNNYSLQGHVRRLSASSAEHFERLFRE